MAPVYLAAIDRIPFFSIFWVQLINTANLPGSELHRGVGRGSFITGRSVHNQRIERLWCVSCIGHLYHLFYAMEDEGLLDPVDEVDLIFLPQINQQLASFKAAYCRHKLRTEYNQDTFTALDQKSHDLTALGVYGLDELSEVCLLSST